MAITRNLSDLRLTCSSSSGTQTFRNINEDATVDEMYDFLSGVASIKNTPYNKIYRTRVYELVKVAE